MAGNSSSTYYASSYFPFIDCTTTSTTDTAWTSWCTDSTSASAYTTTQTIWYSWNNDSTLYYEPTPMPEKTPEERAAEQEAAELARQQREAERLRREEADRVAVERAEALLKSCLDDENRATFEKYRYIQAWSKSGKRYQIKCGRAHNIFELDETGKPIKEYCVHVRDQVPNPDNVLAQKFLIEHQEELFHRLANVRVLA